MNNKIKNIILFLTDRKFFWTIMLIYVFIKLLPVIAFDKIYTYAVVLIAFFILVLRLIKLIIYDKKININQYRLTSIIFIIICSISIIFNIGFDFSKLNIRNSEYRVFFALIINFFVLFSFSSNVDIKNDIKYLDKISLIISIFSFINIILSIVDTIINKRDRIWGLTGSVWSFTHFVAIALAINLYLFIKVKKQPLKVFYIINLILHFIVLLFTQQRAGYLCIIVGSLFTIILLIVSDRILIFKKILIKNKNIIFILMFVLLGLIFLISRYINYKVILSKIINFSSSGRTKIITKGLESLRGGKAILFGLIGNMHNIDINVDSKKIKLLISEAAFHNIFFCILMCFGIIAFVIFILFIIQILKKYILLCKYSKTNNDIFNLLLLSNFGIIGSLFSGFFDDNMIINLPYLPNLLFFILCSIICSIDIKRYKDV